MAKNKQSIDNWFEDEIFWRETEPFLFDNARLESAPAEVDAVLNLLQIKPGATVLDLCCGPGRHALELARRGYQVTGVDRTERYLQRAVQQAKTDNLDIDFIKEDMRRFRKPQTFDAVLSLFTSFGYFEQEDEDLQALENIFESLKPQGKLLLDVMGLEVLSRIFVPREWRELNGVYLLEERALSTDGLFLENRWIIIKEGRHQAFDFKLRIYPAVELQALLQSCGFSNIRICGDLEGNPYDEKAARLVVIAQKTE